MNVCISHALGDKKFAELLATQLCRDIDCSISLWEMSPSDLLIETALKNPDEIDALVILLSKESSESEWCKTKLSEELLHEIEDNGTAEIIVMIEDCEIPEFAQRAMISDFRDATVEETSAISKLIVWTSNARRTLSELYKQELMNGKNPDNCRPQRIQRPARLRLERNDFFNMLFFQKGM